MNAPFIKAKCTKTDECNGGCCPEYRIDSKGVEIRESSDPYHVVKLSADQIEEIYHAILAAGEIHRDAVG